MGTIDRKTCHVEEYTEYDGSESPTPCPWGTFVDSEGMKRWIQRHAVSLVTKKCGCMYVVIYDLRHISN